MQSTNLHFRSAVAMAAAGALAALAVAAPLGAHAQATFDKVRQRGWINVGYRVGAAPFSNQDAKGQPVGYSLEFCASMVDKLRAATGVTAPVRYIAVATDQRLRLLKEGSIDLLCDSTTDTAERRQQADFSTPIFVDAIQVMVRTKDGIKSLDQLKEKSVVVIGTTTAPAVVTQYAADKATGWKIAKVVSPDAAMSQLQLGWAQGYARDGVLLASQRAALVPADFEILPDRLSTEPIAVGFRKGDAAMRKLVDGAITEAMQNGNMAVWYDKWFIKPVPPARPLGIPMSDELKTIIAKSK